MSQAAQPMWMNGGTWPWYTGQVTGAASVVRVSGKTYGAFAVTTEREFHTWREAVLCAVDVASLFNTASKPTVRHRYDRWLLTYKYRPVLMNTKENP